MNTDFRHSHILKELKRVTDEYFMQASVKEYLSKSHVFGNNHEKLGDFLFNFDMQFCRLIGLDYPPHVSLFHKIDDLTTVSYYF